MTMMLGLKAPPLTFKGPCDISLDNNNKNNNRGTKELQEEKPQEKGLSTHRQDGSK